MTALVLSLALGAEPGRPPATHHTGPRSTVAVLARDGVALHTAVRLPDGPGPFPTVVTRVPYALDLALDVQCRVLVRHGYACVYQHVRGRGRSEGDWEPFVHEEHDGQDLVAWVKAQPWADGRVAWIGDSYLAATGWTVALGDPDGLTTLISRVYAPSLYVSAFEDGLLRHELVTAWMSAMPDERRRLRRPGAYRRALATRPRTGMDVAASGHEVPWFREWLSAEDPDAPAWQRPDARAYQRAPETTTLPVMLVGGWSDAFLASELDVWPRLASRSRSLLVIGPWAHLGQAPAGVPLRGVTGPGDGPLAFLQFPRVLRWLDAAFAGTPPPETGVVTYVVGGDRWEHRDAWPPPTRDRRFGAVAGSDRCDGRLEEGADPLAAPLAYTYDPADPLPSAGGDGMLAGALPGMHGVPPGFVRVPDRCPRRADVLRFESAPLPAPLHLAGSVRAELSVRTDAPDTAFGFRLLEQRADGAEIVLREGFSTTALAGGAHRVPRPPGEVLALTPDASPLEAELRPGSRLVAVLTSSSYPSYEAHPNVAGPLSEAVATRVAHQEILGFTLIVPEVVPGATAAPRTFVAAVDDGFSRLDAAPSGATAVRGLASEPGDEPLRLAPEALLVSREDRLVALPLDGGPARDLARCRRRCRDPVRLGGRWFWVDEDELGFGEVWSAPDGGPADRWAGNPDDGWWACRVQLADGPPADGAPRLLVAVDDALGWPECALERQGLYVLGPEEPLPPPVRPTDPRFVAVDALHAAAHDPFDPGGGRLGFVATTAEGEVRFSCDPDGGAVAVAPGPRATVDEAIPAVVEGGRVLTEPIRGLAGPVWELPPAAR